MNGISFKLWQLICEMYMERIYKFYIILITQSLVIKKVHDLLGQHVQFFVSTIKVLETEDFMDRRAGMSIKELIFSGRVFLTKMYFFFYISCYCR